MKQILIGVAIFVLLIFGVLLYTQTRNSSGGIFSWFKNSTVKINDQTYKIDVAKTNEQKEIGLSEKTSIADDHGMLFDFEKPGYYSFWMKKMKFPIDIIFLRDNKIVSIFQNVQPPKSDSDNLPIYTSGEPADKVLELKAGQVEKLNLKKGDEINVNL